MSVAAALLIWAIIVILSMVTALYLARRWGRDPFGWALLSAATGPIAVVGLIGTRQSDIARPGPFERMPNGPSRGGERILAAVDGSPASARIAHYIAELHRPDIEPVLLVVLRREDFQRDVAAARTEHEERIEAATAEALRVLADAGLRANVVVGYGSPGEEIVRCADEQGVGAIAVGRRGAGLTKALLGSVSEYVVRHAKQPVVVVE